MLCKLSQTMLKRHILYTGPAPEALNCTVLEVKKIDGYGTTIDVILADGELHEGDRIVLPGLEGPIDTEIRALLMHEPLKEMRVKNAYRQFKRVPAANGIKIAAKGLEKAVAGLALRVARDEEHAAELAEEMEDSIEEALSGLRTTERGVHVQASTLGSMEALLEYLRSEKVPVSGLSIGPVHKKDVTKCSVQLDKDRRLAMILAFDVAVEPAAQAMADSLGIRIFVAPIIYHLTEHFAAHQEEVRQQDRAANAHIATFPCRLQILGEENVFSRRDPIVVGVRVEEGQLKSGTPITVPGRDFCNLGVVSSLQFDGKPVEIAKKGEEVCMKIEAVGEKKAYGRHFSHEDELVSRISRESIDAVKAFFKEDLAKADWQLMVKLKKLFQVL